MQIHSDAINKMFLAFARAYGGAWMCDMLRPEDVDDKKSVWSAALKNYSPETIAKGALLLIQTEKYPNIAMMCKLCEQIRIQGRFQEISHDHRIGYVRPEMNQETERSIDELFRKLGMQRKSGGNNGK